MGCFVSVEQFSNFEFLLQQMYHIQDHLVQKSIFMEFILVKLQASLHCTECNSTIY